jgi:FMN-dependent NADH-azoreductase
MKNMLIVESSPMGDSSQTRGMTRKLEKSLRAKYPGAEIVRRDLARVPVPHLTALTIKAFADGGADAELSDRLSAELLAADLVVIAAPMWNFGVPSALKAWIDHVVRAGRTFTYGESGIVGLAKGKKAVLVTASGGIYSDGPMKPMDFVEPYLRGVLRFIGIEDVQTVRVEGAMVSAVADKAIPNAERALESLAI